MSKVATLFLTALVLIGVSPEISNAQLMTLKDFDVPPPTAWSPEGCRDVGAELDAQTSTVTWRSLHADQRSSDEISLASAPVFATSWIAETETYNPTGPVFDTVGNIYFAAIAPAEQMAMYSINAGDGTRRWAIPNTTGAVTGFHTPLVLKDPTDSRKEAIYMVLSDRAFAVRPDGSMIWDVPVAFPNNTGIIGIQYHGPTDSLIGVSTDGYIVGIDRKTGAETLAAYELPGEATPAQPTTVPPAAIPCLVATVSTLADLPSVGLSFFDFINLLLGNNIEVANSFSIDPNTGRLWVGATAPDAEDGTIDGVSELGALFGIDLIDDGSGVTAEKVCRVDFQGGTAATPSLNDSGTRVYTADNEGSVLAYDSSDCSLVWELDVGEQVFGSIGVSSDNNELYASSRSAVRQLFDRGDHAELGWTSAADVFDIPASLDGEIEHFNLLLAGISATAVSVQVGVGVRQEARDLPFQQAIVLLDRDTGEARWASEGLDESVAVMSVGPDGGSYIGNSPVRRVISQCILRAADVGALPPLISLQGALMADDITNPVITGGMTKYARERLDLLARDATCAASDRAANAFDHRYQCRDSAKADAKQVLELISQASTVGAQARADGELSRYKWFRLRTKLFWSAIFVHVFGEHGLGIAERNLERGCRTLLR